MDSTYKHQDVEQKIYEAWEKSKYFEPAIGKSKAPFCIILPLPNANDPMHMGHALFTVQDILVRYHRMLGDTTLWLPGGDHAGIETQFVFEKYLAKKDQSRFDFDRSTLYQMIWDFAATNSDLNKNQMKRLGFSLAWTRYHYSLETEIVQRVEQTFRKLYADGLVYRDERLVNYCTKCGTAFSDLEINYVERIDPLYYLKYGPFILATTRPETKFGDTAVAFHTDDPRYQKYLGQEIEISGVNGPFKVKVISDDAIDPNFGMGIEKVTPAHDFLDNEIGKRHHLPVKKVIDLSGRLTEIAGRFAGLKVKAAREAVVTELQKMNLIDHIDQNYVHRVATCYKCGTTIEPLLTPQWYVKTKPLAQPAIEAVKKGLTKIEPDPRFEKTYFEWMEKIADWNISRQIVWGPRIPVWYCLECNPNITLNFLSSSLRGRSETTDAAISTQKNDEIASSQAPRNDATKISGIYTELKEKYSFEEIKSGLQSLIAPKESSYQLTSEKCEKCGSSSLLQETDTFDTWFLSSQWPVNTLKSQPGDFEYFYPTSVLDTMWDILFFWVGRMMMMGIYLTGKVPFKVIHIHSRVVDKMGKKMSKSKGNVMNPLEMADKYGADALRMALIIGVAPASDIAISEDKIRSMRNFTNKIWNIGRFILLNLENKNVPFYEEKMTGLTPEDLSILSHLGNLIKNTTKNINNYRFGGGAEDLYEFTWHEFADKYIENCKVKIENSRSEEEKLATLSVLRHVFLTCLKLLHPFMPFITEELWSKFPRQKDELLLISSWPKS